MSKVQLYPLQTPLSRIDRHDQIPPTSLWLGAANDPTTGRDKLYTLVKHENHLAVLVSYHNLKTHKYYCDQFDFPLKALSWFPRALEEFRKPPAEGGLHAGAMISKDMDVAGEMLAVGSTTDGYDITNRSRNQQDPIGNYDPVRISLSWEFLYKLGFLALWKRLGEQHERGEL